MKRSFGRTERRVILALLVTAILPLLSELWLARELVNQVSDTAFNPEFGQQLDRALGVYSDLVKTMKTSMRHETAAIAAREPLRTAALNDDRRSLEAELEETMRRHVGLLRITIEDDSGQPLAVRQRAAQLDPKTERAFTVRVPLAETDEAPTLVAVFAADRRRVDELEDASEFARAWKLSADASRHERPFLTAFAMLFVLTVLFAVVVGIWVVRPVTKRINRLAAATKPVALGDLSVRVDESGRDELGDLARAFNLMLSSLDHSRARIEFLKRIGEWQSMARRLAHEIKNPLTPIQLAVQECHQRYRGDDPGYRQLLDTTQDIVLEEVASLRHLVGEFAEFARLPRAVLQAADLAEFVREQMPRLQRELPQAEAVLEFDICDEPLPVALDRTMFYRVLSNLVENAFQALDPASESPRLRLSVRGQGDALSVDIEDSGAGIPAALREAIFDPYVTTKRQGTGLGLTIVKKVVMDHGGHIRSSTSAQLGGACIQIRLPRLGTPASDAAVADSQLAMDPAREGQG